MVIETKDTLNSEVGVSNPEESNQWQRRLMRLIDRKERFKEISGNVSRLLHEKILEQGEPGRAAADVLHGKQIGHPLHPILTDITISSWALGLTFDILGFVTRIQAFARTGDHLTVVGTITAIPTAITGMVDYSTIKKQATHYGATHGILNGIALYFYLKSLKSRLSEGRVFSIIFSSVGLLFATAGAWMGGELVYRHEVGVNHTQESKLDEWTPTVNLDEIPDGEFTGVEVDGEKVLLFRQGSAISASNAVCSHAGGPLDKGTIVHDVCVECPWHQSVFDMRTGDVVHSPATIGQARYAVRIMDGTIEVRREQVSGQEAG